ncbi:MAG TPA: hypothetical protein VH301_00905 [Usitatibacter sp.]|jgi:hypothetical protein|nr:hypothetical protein [Usitatibacter sp.]
MRLAPLRTLFALLLLAASFGALAQSMPDFDQLEKRLHIRPEQKEQYDLAVGATRRALLAVGIAALQMKDALVQELAKPSPDFYALARKQNQLIDDQRPLFHEAGEQWQRLYRILDPSQVDTVRDFLHENLGRLLPQ